MLSVSSKSKDLLEDISPFSVNAIHVLFSLRSPQNSLEVLLTQKAQAGLQRLSVFRRLQSILKLRR